MPFMLYEVTAGTCSRSYRRLHTVAVAGNTGPLAHIQRTRNASGEVPFKWHATAADIVAALGRNPERHEIVIDLKPTVAKNVSLYKLLDVWGFSKADWTPLALHLECLFGDFEHEDPKLFKKEFDDRGAKGSRVGEFLYVQGGVQSGSWNWGQIGRVNGTLLWPDAFEYLATELAQALRA